MEWRRETLRGKGDDFCDEQAVSSHPAKVGLRVPVPKPYNKRACLPMTVALSYTFPSLTLYACIKHIYIYRFVYM